MVLKETIFLTGSRDSSSAHVTKTGDLKPKLDFFPDANQVFLDLTRAM